MENLPVPYVAPVPGRLAVEQLERLIRAGRPLSITEKLLHFMALNHARYAKGPRRQPPRDPFAGARTAVLAQRLLDVSTSAAAGAAASMNRENGGIFSRQS